MANFSSTHYIYYNGTGLSSNRFSTDDINWINASATDLTTLEDETSGGLSILDVKDKAKQIKIKGGYQIVGDNSEEDESENNRRFINNVFKARDTYLRTVQINKTNTIFVANSTTNWVASNDAISIAVDSKNFAIGKNSLKVVVDVSNSVNDFATITNASITPDQALDLTTITVSGFDLPINFTSVFGLESVKLRIGQDASNYKEMTTGSQVNDYPFKNGDNLLSFDFQKATETGTVTSATPSWIQIEVIYNSNADDFDFFVSNLYFFADKYTNNYLNCYGNSGNDYDYTEGLLGTSSNFWSFNILCPQEYGQTTFTQLDIDAQITTLQNNQTFTGLGSKTPLPENTFTFVSSVSNVDGLTLTSLNTNRSLNISGQSFSEGDVLTINYQNKSVTLNGTPIYYTGNMEEVFIIGQNNLSLSIAQEATQTVIGDYSINPILTDGQKATYIGRDSTLFPVFPPYPAVGTVARVAQSFTTPGSGANILTKVRMLTLVSDINRVQSLNQTLDLYTDTAGVPGTLVANATNKIIYDPSDPNVGSGVYDQYTVEGDFNSTLTASTTYWLVCDLTLESERTQYFGIGYNDNRTTGGESAYYDFNGSSWIKETNKDFSFEVILNLTPTHTIGWVMRNKQLDY